MKILGKNDWDIIVQLTYQEWMAIGGTMDTDASGDIKGCCITNDPPNVLKLVEALKAIRKATPDLQRIRAALQAFLVLTDSESIQQVLDSCGVASEVTLEPVETTESEVKQ